MKDKQCPDCLAEINSVREFPMGPRRGFYRAECDKCGWRGPKAVTLSNVEYKNQYPCPWCNRSTSGLAELRDHIFGCESFHFAHPGIVPGWVPDSRIPGLVNGIRSLILFHTKNGTMHGDCASDFAELVAPYPSYAASVEVINEAAAPKVKP